MKEEQIPSNRNSVKTEPSCTPKNKMYDTHIEQLDNGYVVRVGCKSFAIGTKDELITLLTRYIKFPDLIEEEFMTGKLYYFDKIIGS